MTLTVGHIEIVCRALATRVQVRGYQGAETIEDLIIALQRSTTTAPQVEILREIQGNMPMSVEEYRIWTNVIVEISVKNKPRDESQDH